MKCFASLPNASGTISVDGTEEDNCCADVSGGRVSVEASPFASPLPYSASAVTVTATLFPIYGDWIPAGNTCT